MPVRLTVRWFSFVEDVFYEGDFKLPQDALEHGLRRELPAQKPGAFTRYSRIVVGMGPGGFVALWLTGGGHRVEVAQFRARAVALPWNVMRASHLDRDDYISLVLNETLDESQRQRLGALPAAPSNRYERLHRRRSVGFELLGVGRGERAWLDMFNGEGGFLDFVSRGGEATLAPQERGLPRHMRLYWWSEEERRFSVDIQLDEEETLAAAEALDSGRAGTSLTFRTRVHGSKVEVSVTRGEREVPLTTGRIQVYRADG